MRKPLLKTDPWTGQPANKKPNLDLLKKWLKKQGFKAMISPIRLLKFPKLPGANYPLLSIALNLFFCWLFWGIYVVHSNEEAVITRFGKYTNTVGPGIHWHIRLVDKIFTVETAQLKRFFQRTSGFSSEGNLVAASFDIKYHIQSPRHYLFATTQPDAYLQALSLSVLREAMGQHTLEQLLSGQASVSIRQTITQHLRDTFTQYPIGVVLTEVSLPTFKLPASLQTALDATHQAKKEAEFKQLQAKADAIKIEQIAQVKAQQLQTQAETWQHQAIAKAHMETKRLLALLPYYEKAPQLTIQQLKKSEADPLLPSADFISTKSDSDQNSSTPEMPTLAQQTKSQSKLQSPYSMDIQQPSTYYYASRALPKEGYE